MLTGQSSERTFREKYFLQIFLKKKMTIKFLEIILKKKKLVKNFFK